MANGQYTRQNLSFGFCPTAVIPSAIPAEPGPTTVTITGLSSSFVNPVTTGMGAMINDEIVVVSSLSGNNLTIARGAADTIPQSHAPGSRIWFFEASIGRVTTTYGATEAVSVKPLPRTLSGGYVPIEASPPIGVTFNSRFARPYPPGQVTVNTQPWTQTGLTLGVSGPLVFAWAHRNRVTQADVLVAHTGGSITPEAGQEYTLRMFRASNDALVATYNTSSNTFTYTAGQANTDLGGTPEPMYVLLNSVRDNLLSRHAYRINFNVQQSSVVTRDFGFNYAIESPPERQFSFNYYVLGAVYVNVSFTYGDTQPASEFVNFTYGDTTSASELVNFTYGDE